MWKTPAGLDTDIPTSRQRHSANGPNSGPKLDGLTALGGARTGGVWARPSRCSGPVRHNGHTTQGCRPPPTHEPSGEPSLGGSLWNLNGPAGDGAAALAGVTRDSIYI